MQDPLEKIATLLKSRRESLDLTQEDLANKSKVALKHLRNIENCNRGELPESVYFLGFLQKIFKALKLENPAQLVENYRIEEGNYILQSLINGTEDLSQKKRDWLKFLIEKFRLYHIYIFLILIIFLMIIISVIIKLPHKKNNRKIIISDLVIDTMTKAIVKGSGTELIVLKMKESANIQVWGTEAKKILFEGKANANSLFEFRDNVGFTVNLERANSAEIDSGKGFEIVGDFNDKISWSYPVEEKSILPARPPSVPILRQVDTLQRTAKKPHRSWRKIKGEL